MRLSDLPLLFVAACLLIAGAVKHDIQGLLTAGFVVLGAWLAVEIIRLFNNRKDKNDS